MADDEHDDRPGGLGKTPRQIRQELHALNAESARLTNETLRAVLQASPDVMMVLDARGRYRAVFTGRPDLLAGPPAHLVGMYVKDVLGPEAAAGVQAVVDAALASGEVEDAEYSLPIGGATLTFAARVVAFPFEGEDCVLWSARDITAQRTAERMLEEAQSIAKVGHWILDATTLTMTGSDQLNRILGAPDGPDCLESFLARVHSDDRETARLLIERAIEGTPWTSARLRLVDADGNETFIQCHGHVDKDGAGKVTKVLGVIQDVTLQERLAARVRQAQKMDAIGTLAGGVAHDMNNVLAVVLSMASVLSKKMTLDSSERQAVLDIRDAALRGKSLVHNLVGFARQGQYTKEPTSLNRLVGDLVRVLTHSIPKRITLATDLDARVEYVDCDPDQINQALMNICLNARDAIEGAGTITVSTAMVDIEDDDAGFGGRGGGRYVRVRVRDTGQGMSAETQNKAFEPFFTTKDVGAGTGLGLALVYGVIDNHGGSIALESELGRGTTVDVLLPASAEPPQAVAASRRTTENDAGDQTSTVLVVDDEDMVRRALRAALEAMGHQVISVESGAGAIDVYRERQREISLVLLDLAMPVMGGAACFERLRELDPEVPVLVCTGHGNSRDTQRMLERGARGVITKPFELDELRVAVASAIR